MKNRSHFLRDAIEDLIATGDLHPGDHLDETELATRFGVSRTPIREALIQLASMGLVMIRPRRGAVVAEVAPEQLVEMFEVMAELEAMCGRLAARRMSSDDQAVLQSAHNACPAQQAMLMLIIIKTSNSTTPSMRAVTTPFWLSKHVHCTGVCGPIGGCN
jgi:DNA-binding GntR family transcriptional regulator